MCVRVEVVWHDVVGRATQLRHWLPRMVIVIAWSTVWSRGLTSTPRTTRCVRVEVVWDNVVGRA